MDAVRMPEHGAKGAIAAEPPALRSRGIDGDPARQGDKVGDASEGKLSILGEPPIAVHPTHVDGDPAVLQKDGLGSVERADREVRSRHTAVVAEVSGRAPDAVAAHRRFGAVSVEDPHPRAAVRGKE